MTQALTIFNQPDLECTGCGDRRFAGAHCFSGTRCECGSLYRPKASKSCPATGRDSSGCLDPVGHVECWQGRLESRAIDAQVVRDLRAADPTY